MHLVFASRMHWDHGRRFIDELANIYFPFKKYNPETKKLQDMHLKARLCPIQLWDYSFPKSHLDPVLNTILGGTSGEGIVAHAHLQKYLWPLKKIMKLQKVPEYNKELQLIMSKPEHSEIIALGVKEDYWITETGEHVAEKDKTDLSWEGI